MSTSPHLAGRAGSACCRGCPLTMPEPALADLQHSEAGLKGAAGLELPHSPLSLGYIGSTYLLTG